jgi:capsular polysaccharide biosynthesis protein
MMKPWGKDYIKEDCYWCSDIYSKAFYHWIAETLPRIHLLARLHPEGALLALPGILSEISYVRDSLKFFPQIKVVFLHKSRMTKFQNLRWISQMGGPYQFNYPLMRSLRESLAPDIRITSHGGTRRLFVSRAKSGRRFLRNEGEIAPLLKAFGFDIVHFETLGLNEQIELCRGCEVLLGIHGAGLANMLFLPEGSSVIEIRKESAEASCFLRMAHSVGIHYDFCLAKCEPGSEGENEVFSDLYLEKEELESTLCRVIDCRRR